MTRRFTKRLVIPLGLAFFLLVIHGSEAGDTDGPGPAPGRGDVNGDQQLDVSDVIYLLNHLFSDGPAPVADETLRPSLPATGQTTCFDCSGNQIACSSQQFPGQDGVYLAGCPMEHCFVDHGDGTITDLCTGLMWERNAVDLDGNASADVMRWCQSLRYCEELTLAGHDDWRLPNAHELASLFDYDGGEEPLPAPFKGPAGAYWTATTDRTDVLRAWTVDFQPGPAIHAKTKATELSHARSVRYATP